MKKNLNPNDLGDIVITSDGSISMHNRLIDESYHSNQGASFEARELYINSSAIKEQFLKKPLCVLDVGLGLAYNALTTITSWQQQEQAKDLCLLSLEIQPDLVDMLVSPQCPWSVTWPSTWLKWVSSLKQINNRHWQTVIEHPQSARCQWDIFIGDAAVDSSWNLYDYRFDFIWQDAFSPMKNPELWTLEWFTKLSQFSNSNAQLMSYSVARTVRDSLESLDWHCERLKAPGKKRHWLRASKKTVISTT